MRTAEEIDDKITSVETEVEAHVDGVVDQIKIANDESHKAGEDLAKVSTQVRNTLSKLRSAFDIIESDDDIRVKQMEL